VVEVAGDHSLKTDVQAVADAAGAWLASLAPVALLSDGDGRA
jgi:hypothetical protein